MAVHNINGQKAEDLSTKYLSNKKYKIIQRNFKTRYCEIDIIAKKKNYIVFVEVKYRARADFGGAIGAVSPKKLSRMTKAAEYYLSQNQQYLNAQPRLDVITVNGDINSPKLSHIRNCNW